MADHLTRSPGGFNPIGAKVPRKPKLLIVEDDDTLRTQMSWALAEEYEVCKAEDRETALEVFRKERPALVTLDLGLPPAPQGVEEGFLALGAILDIDSTAKIVVVTGRAEREYRRNALIIDLRSRRNIEIMKGAHKLNDLRRWYGFLNHVPAVFQ